VTRPRPIWSTAGSTSSSQRETHSMPSRFTRREFGKLTLAGLTIPRVAGASVLADSVVAGVHLGVQTYSFRELPREPGTDAVATVIRSMKECELTECELFAPQVEPQFNRGGGGGGRGRRGAPPTPEEAKAREDLRRWRLETPLSHFQDVGRKFKSA